jgi:hypothetical protein
VRITGHYELAVAGSRFEHRTSSVLAWGHLPDVGLEFVLELTEPPS